MKARTLVSRLLATALCLGGLVGIGFSVILLFAAFIKGSGIREVLAVLLSLGFLALFAWTMHVGMLLFTDKPKGWRMATLLYATQIPVLGTSWIRYDWFTGINLDALLAHANATWDLGLNGRMGAASHLYIFGGQSATYFGINLFALLACILLLKLSRTRQPAAPVG